MVEIPTQCPACGGLLTFVNMQLFCKNKDCSAQTLKQLIHFAKTLDIKGLGEKTLEKLDFESAFDIYEFSEGYFTDTLGFKLGGKLYQEIQTSKTKPFEVFLAAVGIPLVGPITANKLVGICEQIYDISRETCRQAGIGEKATQNLLDWLEEGEWQRCPNLNFSKETEVTKWVVCITGKLTSFKSKSTAETWLRELGCKVTSTVTKETNVLISEDGKTSSSKYQQALSKNLKILTISQFKDTYEKMD